MPLDIVPSLCPHDCPSACALEVERIDGGRIGRTRGAASQSYTDGVVCAKVARYAERQHHPARLSTPLRRIGDKGRGCEAFVPIAWDDALADLHLMPLPGTDGALACAVMHVLFREGHADRACHPGFAMSATDLIERTLAASGLPPTAEFAPGGQSSGWLDCRPAFATEHFLDGFGHADGKFHFRARWAAIGPECERLPAFPDHVGVIDDGDPEQPFRLVPAPSRSFLNTSFNNTPSSLSREGRPTVLVHPAALAELGLESGDRLRIGNRQGSLVVHARAFAGLQRRVVVVEGLWPNHAFEEGIGINLLTSADRGLPRGGAVFHDTSVWLRPA